MLIKFVVKKLVDVDEFSDGCPYVRITNVNSNGNNEYKETGIINLIMWSMIIEIIIISSFLGRSIPKSPKSNIYVYNSGNICEHIIPNSSASANDSSLFFIQVYCDSIKAKHTICYPGIYYLHH